MIYRAVIIFHFEGMSFSSAHDLKQWDFLDNNEIFSEFAQFIRQHILTILTIKQLVVKRPSLTLLFGGKKIGGFIKQSKNHLLVGNVILRVILTLMFDEDFAWQAWKSSFKMGA